MSNSFNDPNLIDNLSASHVRDLVPYESARRLFSGGQYWLNANESPFSNRYELDDSHFNRYPDCQPGKVINAYAQYAGIAKESVLVSRGADEGIELLIRAFCEPATDKIVICPPTYGMYAISANTFNVAIQKAPLKNDFSLDLDALHKLANRDKPPKLVFVCSPNNPTGTRVGKEQLTQVLELFAGKSLVVVDEAYIEFDIEHSWANQISDFDNLVILRTLSKAFALAGIRCGFLLAQPAIIKVLLKVIAPYPVSEPVAQIAAQALSNQGIETMQSQVETLRQQQALLMEQCQQFPDWKLVGDKCANFLLYRIPEKQTLMDHLVKQGMLIRDQSKQINLDNCLRISIGNAEENQQLLTLFKQFYNL